MRDGGKRDIGGNYAGDERGEVVNEGGEERERDRERESKKG